MTVKVTVSVDGDYRIAVKQGEVTTWVSGRDHDGPVVQEFTGPFFVIGPEEVDPGDG